MAPRLSPGYVHAVHPEHGQPVVYQPGQALPDWLVAELDAGGVLVPDEHEGSFTLHPAKRKAGRHGAG
jgi:hypothetical protein